jgi:hypothetical protein
MSELNANTEVFELLSNPISGDNPLLQILKSDNDEINSFRKRITKYALVIWPRSMSTRLLTFRHWLRRVRRAVLKEREVIVRQLSAAHSNSKYDTSFLPQYRYEHSVRLVAPQSVCTRKNADLLC